MSNLYAIADIHGRLDLLENLWRDLLKFHDLDLSRDKVVFTGDYVDRGPDSFGVLDFIYELNQQHPNNAIALAGNHEWLMLMYYARGNDDDRWMWDNNGGFATKESFTKAGELMCPGYLLDWLKDLPFYHEEPGFFFSHAPAPRENRRKLINQGKPFTPDELTWTYDPDEFGIARDHGNGIVGVCGHVHALRKGLMEPRFYDHYIYADAGCGCSPKAPLCAVEVKTKEVIYAWPEKT